VAGGRVCGFSYFRGTMRKQVHPLERNENMLKTKPNRPQYSTLGKYGKKGSCAVKQVRCTSFAWRRLCAVLPCHRGVRD
jgi:hypothetical protein